MAYNNLIAQGVVYSREALNDLLHYNDKHWLTVFNIFAEAHLTERTQLPEKLLSRGLLVR